MTGDVLGTNLFAYANNNPVVNIDPTGNWSIAGFANQIDPSVVFASFMTMLFDDLALGLAKVGLYVTKILLPKVASALWYNPWLVAGIVVGAVAIVTATVVILYNTRVAKINNDNMNKKVKDILKTKKGSIKNAPLPPGGPNWNDLLEKTLKEIKELANKGVKGFKEIYKLLTDGRFNR